LWAPGPDAVHWSTTTSLCRPACQRIHRQILCPRVCARRQESSSCRVVRSLSSPVTTAAVPTRLRAMPQVILSPSSSRDVPSLHCTDAHATVATAPPQCRDESLNDKLCATCHHWPPPAVATVRAPPRRRAIRSHACRLPALPPLGARCSLRGCLCAVAHPPPTRTEASKQNYAASRPSHAASARLSCSMLCAHPPWQTHPVTPCADTPMRRPLLQRDYKTPSLHLVPPTTALLSAPVCSTASSTVPAAAAHRRQPYSQPFHSREKVVEHHPTTEMLSEPSDAPPRHRSAATPLLHR
jgi:hypothetical protein